MSDKDKSSIELTEFIQQVKEDLLSVTPGKDKDAPFLFVESVELELQVTAKRTGRAGAKGSINPHSAAPRMKYERNMIPGE